MFMMVAAVSVLSWLAVEVYRFARGKSFISGGHLALRAVNAALVLGVVTMIMYGGYRTWPGGRDGAVKELVYWSACLAVVVVILLLTMRDWRWLMKARHLKAADLYRKLDEQFGDTSGADAREDK